MTTQNPCLHNIDKPKGDNFIEPNGLPNAGSKEKPNPENSDEEQVPKVDSKDKPKTYNSDDIKPTRATTTENLKVTPPRDLLP